MGKKSRKNRHRNQHGRRSTVAGVLTDSTNMSKKTATEHCFPEKSFAQEIIDPPDAPPVRELDADEGYVKHATGNICQLYRSRLGFVLNYLSKVSGVKEFSYVGDVLTALKCLQSFVHGKHVRPHPVYGNDCFDKKRVTSVLRAALACREIKSQLCQTFGDYTTAEEEMFGQLWREVCATLESIFHSTQTENIRLGNPLPVISAPLNDPQEELESVSASVTESHRMLSETTSCHEDGLEDLMSRELDAMKNLPLDDFRGDTPQFVAKCCLASLSELMKPVVSMWDQVGDIIRVNRMGKKPIGEEMGRIIATSIKTNACIEDVFQVELFTKAYHPSLSSLPNILAIIAFSDIIDNLCAFTVPWGEAVQAVGTIIICIFADPSGDQILTTFAVSPPSAVSKALKDLKRYGVPRSDLDRMLRDTVNSVYYLCVSEMDFLVLQSIGNEDNCSESQELFPALAAEGGMCCIINTFILLVKCSSHLRGGPQDPRLMGFEWNSLSGEEINFRDMDFFMCNDVLIPMWDMWEQQSKLGPKALRDRLFPLVTKLDKDDAVSMTNAFSLQCFVLSTFLIGREDHSLTKAVEIQGRVALSKFNQQLHSAKAIFKSNTDFDGWMHEMKQLMAHQSDCKDIKASLDQVPYWTGLRLASLALLPFVEGQHFVHESACVIRIYQSLLGSEKIITIPILQALVDASIGVQETEIEVGSLWYASRTNPNIGQLGSSPARSLLSRTYENIRNGHTSVKEANDLCRVLEEDAPLFSVNMVVVEGFCHSCMERLAKKLGGSELAAWIDALDPASGINTHHDDIANAVACILWLEGSQVDGSMFMLM